MIAAVDPGMSIITEVLAAAEPLQCAAWPVKTNVLEQPSLSVTVTLAV